MARATGTFTVSSWDEAPYDAAEGEPPLARADVVFRYAGDFEGEGRNVTLLACYDEESGATSYVGHERMTGRLAGREGSFVVELNGIFDAGVARGSWRIVPGTGRGALTGITGDGGGESAHDRQPFTWWLDYELPASG